MKLLDKQRAVALRKIGKSYREILKEVNVSKGTLSLWLKDIPISDEQRNRLTTLNRRNRKGFGSKIKELWVEKKQKLRDGYEPPLTDPEFVIGTALYWAEGTKANHDVCVANTDFRLLNKFKSWIEKYFAGEYFGFTVHVLHHYGETADFQMIEHWSKQLNLSVSCFRKCVHVKPRGKRESRKIGFGIASIYVRGKEVWRIKEKIKKAIECVSAGA